MYVVDCDRSTLRVRGPKGVGEYNAQLFRKNKQTRRRGVRVAERYLMSRVDCGRRVHRPAQSEVDRVGGSGPAISVENFVTTIRTRDQCDQIGTIAAGT